MTYRVEAEIGVRAAGCGRGNKMTRITMQLSGAVALVVLLGLSSQALAGASPAACAEARSRLASAQSGSAAQLRLADEASVSCAAGSTVGSVRAASRTMTRGSGDEQIAHLDRLLTGVTPGSPAHFRLLEERGKVAP